MSPRLIERRLCLLHTHWVLVTLNSGSKGALEAVKIGKCSPGEQEETQGSPLSPRGLQQGFLETGNEMKCVSCLFRTKLAVLAVLRAIQKREKKKKNGFHLRIPTHQPDVPAFTAETPSVQFTSEPTRLCILVFLPLHVTRCSSCHFAMTPRKHHSVLTFETPKRSFPKSPCTHGLPTGPLGPGS